MRQMHWHFAWAHELATHPRILDAVEDLLGPNLLVWATELFAKHARDANVSIGWHRDGKYSGFSSDHSLTAWIALSPSTTENGCLRAVPGPRRKSGGENLASAIDVTLSPGEMSLHDADILHGSEANQSGEKRVGFAIRYVTPEAFITRGSADTEQMGAPGSPLLLARGLADDRIPLALPTAESNERLALARMKDAASRHLDQILHTLNRQALTRS
jgi:ectoine hydroxylase-related dioxygenase (phytanoyl-CoA dioxygenase family)